MKKGSVRILALAAMTAAAVLTAAAGSASEIDREFHREFEVRPGMTLKLDHGDGDVIVSPWDRDTLDVHVIYRARGVNVGWSASTDFDVEFRERPDMIEVIGKEPNRITIGVTTMRESEYLYTIRAPKYVELQFEGDDGDIEIDGWEGQITLRLEDGDIRLTDIDAPRTEVVLEDGDLEIDGLVGELVVEMEDGDVDLFNCETMRAQIRLEDGDLTLDSCSGSFELYSADGDLHLSRLEAEKLEIRLQDGSADVALLKTEDLDMNVRTGDGNVVVDLEEGISAEFTIETGDGRIRVSADDVHEMTKERHRVSGEFGDGRGRIYIRTADGSVTLRQ